MFRFPAAHIGLVLFFTLSLGGTTACADRSDPSAQSSVLPSPAESGLPEKISQKEVRRIRRAFTELLENERDALRAENARRRREANAERKQRKKFWDREEKLARRKFFENQHVGAEKREYMRAFSKRRSAFYEQLNAEDRQQLIDLDSRWRDLKPAQRNRLKFVEDSLRRSERPAPRLLERAE